MQFGYTMLGEQTPPRQFVADLAPDLQVGALRQGDFFAFAEKELLPALRSV